MSKFTTMRRTMQSRKRPGNNAADASDEELRKGSDDSTENDYSSIPVAGIRDIEVGGSDIEIDADSIVSSSNLAGSGSLYAEDQPATPREDSDNQSSEHLSSHNIVPRAFLRISQHRHFTTDSNPPELHFPRSHMMAKTYSMGNEELQRAYSNASGASLGAGSGRQPESDDKYKKKHGKTHRHHHHRHLPLFSGLMRSKNSVKEDMTAVDGDGNAGSGVETEPGVGASIGASIEPNNDSTATVSSVGSSGVGSLRSSEMTRVAGRGEEKDGEGDGEEESNEKGKSTEYTVSLATTSISQETPPAIGMSRGSSMTVASSAMKKTKSVSRFKSFTRRAARIAEDIAFGTTVYSTVSNQNFKNVDLPARAKLSGYEKRQMQMAEFRKNLQDAQLRIYFETLRFFLKYMDDSNADDPLNYALTRKNMWLLWYQKLVARLGGAIELYEQQQREKDGLASDVLHGKKVPGLERQRSGFKNVVKVKKLHSSAGERGKTGMPSAETVAQSMFQDRRVVLSLLWYLQLSGKLLKQAEVFKDQLPAEADQNEVCIVSTSKMNAFKKRALTESELRALEKAVSETLEFVDGWNIRHSVPGAHINVITAASRFLTLTDMEGKGYLDEPVLKQNPQFGTQVISKYYYTNHIGGREKEFLKDYSSFTTPSISHIPLRSSSQSLLICEDVEALVCDAGGLTQMITEFKRVLKPQGKLYLQLWDIDPDTQRRANQKDTTHSVGEFVWHSLWHSIADYASKNGTAVTDLTKKIVPMLQAIGFSDVRTAFIAYPMLTSLNSAASDINSTRMSQTSSTIGDLSSMRNDNSILGSTAVQTASATTQAARASQATQASNPVRSVPVANPAPVPPPASSLPSPAEKGRLHGPSTSSRTGRDPRLDSFFEMMTSFTEFLKIQKVLNLATLTKDLSECEEIDALKKDVGEHGDPTGIKQQEINTRIMTMKPLDTDRINLAKLFVDYKVNGFNGNVVGSKILEGSPYANPKYLSTHRGTIEDDVLYEGLGYMMVVTAVKKDE